MMQPALQNYFSTFDTQIMDLEVNSLLVDLEFPSPLLCGDSRIFSPSFNFPISYWPNNFNENQTWDTEIHYEIANRELSINMDELDHYMSDETYGMSIDSISSEKYSIIHFNEGSPCSVLSSSQIYRTNGSPIQSEVFCMDENNELSLFHLLRAYAEATEREQTTLMDVIQGCISDKASPIGETMERLAFSLFKTPQYSYIKQEFHVNVEIAKKTLYNLFPYGRFAHLAANSAILEAIPVDSKTVTIIDFDIDDGVQWAPLIETLGHQKKELTLVFVKWTDDELPDSFSLYNSENTRKRLLSHARSVGAKLRVQEVEIEDLVCEIKRQHKRYTETQWFAFNCMVSLPHMVNSRSKAKLYEFLRVARDVLGDPSQGGSRGIITFGDGEADTKLTNLSNYSSFFEKQVHHYQALLKSVECTLPDQFTEAKVAIECLFLSPHISSHKWLQKWEETTEEGSIQATIGLEGLKLSQNTLMEASQLVRGENSYALRMGQDTNETVLEWRGTPLVKLSTWK